MRRLGASEAQLQRWEPELRRVFPDVKEGDSIVGVHYPGRGAAFYHRGRATGEVVDAEFARLFFAIWLDPRSRSPSLRAALLKRPEDERDRLPRALPRRQLLAYGALGLPLAMAALPVYVHVPRLYAESAGMSLSLLGSLLLAARLLDAGIDPLLGGWSDRTASRQRLIVLALPCLALGMLALLHPPAVAAPLWLLASMLCTYFGFSLASVAYQAWGAELGRDSGERTRLTASREGFGLLGVVLAAALPGLLSQDLAQGLSGLARIFVPSALAPGARWTLLGAPASRGAPSGRRRAARRSARVFSTIAAFGACWRSSWSTASPPPCRRRWFCSMSPTCCGPRPGAGPFSRSTSSAASPSCRCGSSWPGASVAYAPGSSRCSSLSPRSSGPGD